MPAAGKITSSPSAIDDKLIRLAFDNSFQANIIADVNTGKIIMANKAAAHFFGYTIKTFVTKGKKDIFKTNESGFKNMLKERTEKGRASAIVTAIKKNGKLISCRLTSAVFYDANGLVKSITNISDMSRSILDQNIIDAEKERIVAADIVLALLKQNRIDIQKDKEVAANIVLAVLKQSRIDVQKEKAVANNIIRAELKQEKIDMKKDKKIASDIGIAISKQKVIDVKNNKIVADNIVLAKSKQKVIDVKNNKIVADNIILAKSKQKKIDIKKERKVADNIILAKIKSASLNAEYIKWKKYIGKTSYDVMWDWNIADDTIYIGDSIEEVFGYKLSVNTISFDAFSNCLLQHEREIVKKGVKNVLASRKKVWNDSFVLKRFDGSLAVTNARAVILRTKSGKATHLIGAIKDISELRDMENKLDAQTADMNRQKMLGEKLEHEISLKEKQIADAMIDAKDTERSDIGKELHDNVNQLLGASKMYLEMAKRGGEHSEMYLGRSSEYTLTAIEEIRKLTRGLTTDIIKNLGLCESIEKIARDTMEVNPVKISCALNKFIEGSVSEKFKLNVFRILQEHLNNILKHADATKVGVRLSQNQKNIKLSVVDNGVGFDTDKKQKGIGLDNIKSRAVTYNGTAYFITQPGEGCTLNVIFPLPAAG